MSYEKNTNYELVDLEVDKISLDKSNPRIQLALDTYGKDQITAPQIALALKEGEDGSSTTLDKLKESIRKCGRIINPIVVNHVDGEYVCIEGNTRVQIYRDFEKAGVEGKWTRIPCLLFENASEVDIDTIRLQAHLVGPRAWTPYAKARYIHKLWHVDHLSQDEIISYCGGNRKGIEDQLAAFKLFEEVYKENYSDVDVKNFSGFVEYQDRKVKYAVASNDFEPKDFCEWINKGNFSRLEDVRQLPRILENEEACKTFLSENSREALKILNRPTLDEIIEKLTLDEILDAVIQKIILLEANEKNAYQANSTEILSRLKSAKDKITGLIKELEVS